ncbi:hypothetical protein D3C80_2097410 [compost metagenome]
MLKYTHHDRVMILVIQIEYVSLNPFPLESDLLIHMDGAVVEGEYSKLHSM